MHGACATFSTSPIIPFNAVRSLSGSGFKLQSLADTHNCHAMVADRSRHQHGIANLRAMRAHLNSSRNTPMPAVLI